MTEVGIRGVDLLQDRMQKAQESLKDVDENLKKLTGRSPGEFRGGRRGRGGLVGRTGRDGGPGRMGDGADRGARLFSIARRSIGGASSGVGMNLGRVRDGVGSVRGRERDRVIDRRTSSGGRYDGDSEEEFGSPVGKVLSSKVRPSIVEVPSREESLSKQKPDKKGLARNKRMFGLLLGTLQKFKNDTTQEDQTKKRLEIEEKLEKKAKDEKAEIYRKKQELWNARRMKTKELRQLETKLELVENHQHWETETLKMKNFIRTETKPYIFWLPKDHIPETLRKHASSKKAIDALIEERKNEMEKDIEALLIEAENENKEDSDHQHSDDESESPNKRRRLSPGGKDGSDLDEAMKEADTEMTVNEDVSHEEKPSNTDERFTNEDVVPLESEEINMESAEALTGQPQVKSGDPNVDCGSKDDPMMEGNFNVDCGSNDDPIAEGNFNVDSGSNNDPVAEGNFNVDSGSNDDPVAEGNFNVDSGSKDELSAAGDDKGEEQVVPDPS